MRLFNPLTRIPCSWFLYIYLTLQVLEFPAHGPRRGGGGIPPDPHRVGPGRVEDDEVHGDDAEVGEDEEDHGEADLEGLGGGRLLAGLTVEGGQEGRNSGGETGEGQEESQGPHCQT